MKKYIFIILAALTLSLASCVTTDVEPGGTSVQNMAGQWTVTFEQSVDEYYCIFYGEADPDLSSKTAAELDTMEWADIYGSGKVSIYTYNTADNTSTAMWFSDYAASSSDYTFWEYKIKVNVDYEDLTFSCDTVSNTSYDDCQITVLGGKVLLGAATTPRGAVADSIIAYVKFSDDSYGFTYMKMSGYRYTGFDEDK